MKDDKFKNDSFKNDSEEEQEEQGGNCPNDKAEENINDFGITNLPFNFNSEIQYMSIIGHIEGHNTLPPQNKTTKYEHIIPQLIAVEENPKIKGLLTVLNTVGGDVEAGLAIAELIATISKPTVSIVLGGGHSIGAPLATASKYSFIAESATMTLHPIRMNGLVISAEQTFNYFRKMQERIVDFIVRTSKTSKEVVTGLMNETDDMANDMGTILIGKEAVELGLIDEVGGLHRALEKLREMIKEQEGQGEMQGQGKMQAQVQEQGQAQFKHMQ